MKQMPEWIKCGSFLIDEPHAKFPWPPLGGHFLAGFFRFIAEVILLFMMLVYSFFFNLLVSSLVGGRLGFATGVVCFEPKS
jgi:hypothetical protein